MFFAPAWMPGDVIACLVLLFVLCGPLANHSAVMYFGKVTVIPRHGRKTNVRHGRKYGRVTR